MNRLKIALISLFTAGAIANAYPMGGGANDPFAQMDEIFRVQLMHMQQMQKQLDKLFSNYEKSFQGRSLIATPVIMHSGGILSSGFQDKKDHYELVLKIDDLKDSKINITTQDNILTIEVSTQKKVEKKEGNYGKVISYTNSSASQSFTLPPDADASTIEAKQKGNTIIITIKKRSKAKVIPIKKEVEKKIPVNKK